LRSCWDDQLFRKTHHHHPLDILTAVLSLLRCIDLRARHVTAGVAVSRRQSLIHRIRKYVKNTTADVAISIAPTPRHQADADRRQNVQSVACA
jgi:hypothetical protein